MRSPQTTEFSIENTEYQIAHQISSDEAIENVGGKNRFQIFGVFVICLTFSTSSFIAFGLPYLYSQKQVNLVCHYNDGSVGICLPKEACNEANVVSFDYIHDRHKTLVNWVVDYELACQKESTLSLISSAYFGGFLVSSMVFLTLSDIVGRKIITISGLLLQFLSIIGFFLVKKVWYLYFFAAMIGIRSPMASHVPFMQFIQMTSPQARSKLSLFINGFDGFVTFILALVYQFLSDYVPWFIAVECIVFVMLMFNIFYLPESPRYYIVKKKYEKARSVYKWIARINGKQMFDQMLEGQTIHRLKTMKKSNSEFFNSSNVSQEAIEQFISDRDPRNGIAQKKTSICDLWRGKSARERSMLFIFPYIWFIVDIVTYGVSFSINDMKGNIYDYGMLLGLASFVVAITGSFVADKLGRKGAFFLTWGLCVIGCTLYQFLSKYQIMLYILIVISKLGASGSFGLAFLVTSEYFPTVYRGLMFGICNVMARIGGVISPEFSTVFFPHYFMLVFGLMSLSIFFLNFLLYETQNRKMPDNVESQKEKDGLINEEEAIDPRKLLDEDQVKNQ